MANDFGFVPKTSANNFGFVPKNTAPDISEAESAGRGLLKQAGWGLQNSYEPAVERGIANVADMFGADPSVKQNYDENLSDEDLRKTVNDQNSAAQKANPLSYLGGEIAGGAPALAAAGAAAPSILGAGSASPIIASAARLAPTAGLFAAQHFNEASDNPDLLDRSVGAAKSGIVNSLGGEIGGNLMSRAGSAMQAAPGTIKSAFAKWRGISPETLDVLINKPHVIDEIEQLGGGDIEKGLQEHAEQVAKKISNSKTDYVNNAAENIDQRLDRLGNVKISPSRFEGAITDQQGKLAPGGVAITPEVVQAGNTLENIRGNLQNVANKNAASATGPGVTQSEALHYLPGSTVASAEQFGRVSPENFGSNAESTVNYTSAPEVKPVEMVGQNPFLTPKQINTARKQLNDAAEGIYNAGAGERVPEASAYRAVADRAREVLGNLDPEIAAQNQKLKAAIEAQQNLGRFGLNSSGPVDSTKLSKLLAASPKIAAQNAGDVATIDQHFGTDLGDQINAARAAKELNPTGIWGTLRSAAQSLPLIGAGAEISHITHSPTAAILGLAASAANSPMLTKPMVRGATALTNNVVTDNTVKPVLNLISDLLTNNPQRLGTIGSMLNKGAQTGAGALAPQNAPDILQALGLKKKDPANAYNYIRSLKK